MPPGGVDPGHGERDLRTGSDVLHPPSHRLIDKALTPFGDKSYANILTGRRSPVAGHGKMAPRPRSQFTLTTMWNAKKSNHRTNDFAAKRLEPYEISCV